MDESPEYFIHLTNISNITPDRFLLLGLDIVDSGVASDLGSYLNPL